MNNESVTDSTTHATPLWQSVLAGLREEWKPCSTTALQTARDNFLARAECYERTAAIFSASTMQAEKCRDMAKAADEILAERFANLVGGGQ